VSYLSGRVLVHLYAFLPLPLGIVRSFVLKELAVRATIRNVLWPKISLSLFLLLSALRQEL
jgi:hypothetical protein